MSHMVSLCLASAKRNCYTVSQSCVMFPTYPQEGLRIREGKGLTGGRDPWAKVLLTSVILTPLLERDSEIETHGSWTEPRCKLGSHLHRAGGEQVCRRREECETKRAGSRSLGWGVSPKKEGELVEKAKGELPLNTIPSQALQSELTSSCVTLGRLLTLSKPWSPCL